MPWKSRTAIDPDDDASLFYTSGTTGPPKGVPLSHRNLASQIAALGEANLVNEGDPALVPLPFHHVYPFVTGILAPLASGEHGHPCPVSHSPATRKIAEFELESHVFSPVPVAQSDRAAVF